MLHISITNFFVFKPNSIALSFLLCAIINFLFTFYLIRKKNTTMTIFWFLLFTIVSGLADGANGFLNMSANKETFQFWLTITDFCIILPAPLQLSFGLSFANKNYYLKKLWITIPLFLVFFFMIFLSLNTDFVFSHDFDRAIRVPWGITPLAGVGNFIVGIYFLINQAIYTSILIYAYITNTDQRRKKQIRILVIVTILVGFGITITKGFIPRVLNIPVFPSDIYFDLALVGTTIYVFFKYGFNAFNIDSVSEKLMQLIPSAVVIIDSNNCIQLVNPSAESLFQIPAEKLIGTVIKAIFFNADAYEKFITIIVTPLRNQTRLTTELHQVKVLSQTGKAIFVEIHATILKDSPGKSTNIVVIFTSIQAVLDQADQLTQRIEEIEKQKSELVRMNETMINREIKMGELKKENEALKAQLHKNSSS